MKVVLINPPSPFLIDEMVMPPLGLCYLSSILKDNGYQVEILNLSLGGTIADIPDADLVCITATTPQIGEARCLLESIKARTPSLRVALGGPHASAMPENCLFYGFDAVVVGEGEKAILDVAKGATGIISREFMHNLDDLPFPDRSFIGDYNYYLDGEKATTMMTGRGCPWSCSFCCKSPWGRRLRLRSPKHVLAEASAIAETGLYGGIMAFDDELLVDWERDEEIFRGFHKLGLIYRIFTRADMVKPEKCNVLAKTGCYEVLLGIESGSNRILANIHKGTTRELNLKAVRMLKKAGIRVKAAIICGLPGESWESIRETESFLEKAQPDDVDFSVLAVYPGSHIWEYPNEYDVTFPTSPGAYKTKPGEYQAGVATSHMTAEEIVRARDELEAKFKKWTPKK